MNGNYLVEMREKMLTGYIVISCINLFLLVFLTKYFYQTLSCIETMVLAFLLLCQSLVPVSLALLHSAMIVSGRYFTYLFLISLILIFTLIVLYSILIIVKKSKGITRIKIGFTCIIISVVINIIYFIYFLQGMA